jgi:FAD/FMN-containing dehydrogenase
MRTSCCFYYSRRRSSFFSHLDYPTSKDAYEFFLRMNSRPGSVLTTFMDANVNLPHPQSSLDKYNVDWTKHYRGNSSIVVRPESTQEVVQIMEYCQERRLGIVPQGGNTGLVGGSVPMSSQEIVVSLEQMNQIYNKQDDEHSRKNRNILRADAGSVLQDLQAFAAQNMDCLVPVDLGAKGSCQIGGNLSSNAGGVYYYRYGSLHANCLGLEVVVPNGEGKAEILNLSFDPASHLKDNTGYDLKHLFIGAEGTLGIITKVALWCPPLPKSVGAVWLTCHTLRDVIEILNLARTKFLTEILAAFEFMDHDVLRLVKSTHNASFLRLPVDIDDATSGDEQQNYSVLIETHGSNEVHDQEKLAIFVDFIMQKHLIVDGVMAQNLGQVQAFWNVRDLCNPSAAATGYVYKYDVSLAATDFNDFICEMKSRLRSYENAHCTSSAAKKDLRCVNWGHIIGKCKMTQFSLRRRIDLLHILSDSQFVMNVVFRRQPPLQYCLFRKIR